jgi:hypothetical protein
MGEGQDPRRLRRKEDREAGRIEESGRYQRVLHELRGRRFIDLDKDTQFSDAWVVLPLWRFL